MDHVVNAVGCARVAWQLFDDMSEEIFCSYLSKLGVDGVITPSQKLMGWNDLGPLFLGEASLLGAFGQLDDGRAITLGEIIHSRSERWELQFEGVGRTIYSQVADGVAILRISISEARHGLGIPTTRALCLVTTGKHVTRDMFYGDNLKEDPGAIFCRVAQSFILFGLYQIHTSREKRDLGTICALADYVIRHHFPCIENMNRSESLSFGTHHKDHSVVDLTSNTYAAWAVEVAERTATLSASWQGVGFTHGVVNTDNMSIWGLSIDYGPFGFLDDFDLSYTPNTTDLPGRRYYVANQLDMGLWNIGKFTSTLSTAQLINDKESVEIQGEPSGVHQAVGLILNHLRKFLVDRSIVWVFETQMKLPNIRANQELFEDEAEDKLQDAIQENHEFLSRCINENMGFKGGKPLTACIDVKCLIHWHALEFEQTQMFDFITDGFSTWVSYLAKLIF